MITKLLRIGLGFALGGWLLSQALFPAVHNNLAALLVLSKYRNPEGGIFAAALTQPSLERNPYLLGLLFLQQGRPDEAIALFSDVHSKSKDRAPIAFYWIGEVYRAQGNWAGVLENWGYVGLWRQLEDYAKELVELGDIEGAETILRYIFSAAPDNWQVAVSLAQLYEQKLMRANEAVNVLEQAVARNPNQLWLVLPLGNMYFAQKDYTSADKWYRHAVELWPNDSWAHFFLGRSQLMQGNIVEGCSQLKQAMRDAPSDSPIQAAFNKSCVGFDNQE